MPGKQTQSTVSIKLIPPSLFIHNMEEVCWQDGEEQRGKPLIFNRLFIIKNTHTRLATHSIHPPIRPPSELNCFYCRYTMTTVLIKIKFSGTEN